MTLVEELHTVVSKAAGKARRDGLSGLMLEGPPWAISEARRRVHVRAPVTITPEGDVSRFKYQQRRRDGVEERLTMIEPRLREHTSVLDIGCNAGLLTAKIAETDRFVIGMEKNTATLADAVEYHGPALPFCLIAKPLTPETVTSLPTVDYVLLLSVYHKLYGAYGRKTAESLLEKVSTKVTDTLFFEPASQKQRYRDPTLPFDDFDSESIIDYNVSMLHSVIDRPIAVEYLGSSSRRRDFDGERHLFAVSME